MNTIHNILEERLLSARMVFNSENLSRHIFIEGIDCSELPPKETNGKNLPEDLKTKIFAPLHSYDKNEIEVNLCPAIYVFELCEEEDSNRIVNAISDARESILNRQLPALRKNWNKSKYLYVGKVESQVGGRIVTHLGYYQNQMNHGLQLSHWSRDLEPAIKLNLHVFRFEKKFKPYIAAMEVSMAKELRPLIGKH